MKQFTNKLFDEIQIGETATYSKLLTAEDARLFAKTSGDTNPVHLDADYAKGTVFGACIGHGMWSGALVSAAIATTLPGPGSIYRSQTLKFIKPAYIGDTLTVTLIVTEKKDRVRLVTLDCIVANQNGIKIASGTAEVITPDQKLSITAPEL